MPGTEFFGQEEIDQVMDVMRNGVMFRYGHDNIRNNRWKALELEDAVKSFTGAPFAHAVSSGSAAVACALAAAGVGHGDEVIVPPFTFLATIEAVIFAGGIPVFAEIDETLCLSADGIRKALTPNTKAVCLVHMCGAAADMDAIMSLCKEKNLVLVEDAGQALGAFYNGKSVGLFGVAGAFSYDYFKIATCGEGGVFICNDKKVYNIAEQYSDHGHDHNGNNRGMEQHPVLGFNYRISELHAAVGLAQMRKLKDIKAAKLKHKSYIKKELSNIKGITFRKLTDEAGDSGTFLNFFLPNQELAEKAVKAFAAEGLTGFNYWFRNMYHFINQWDHLKELRSGAPLAVHHLGTPQDYSKLELPVTQEVVGRLISLGIKGKWPQEELQEFTAKVKKVLESVLSGVSAS